jgi:anti-anti-sigma factor
VTPRPYDDLVRVSGLAVGAAARHRHCHNGRGDGGTVAIQIGAEVGEGETRLAVLGEIDLTSVDELERALTDTLAGRPARVVLDLGGVTFIDSSGINALVGGYRRGQDQGATVVVANTPPPVRHVLELVGVYSALAEA